jgi:hypothetical protein
MLIGARSQASERETVKTLDWNEQPSREEMSKGLVSRGYIRFARFFPHEYQRNRYSSIVHGCIKNKLLYGIERHFSPSLTCK